MDPTHDPLPEWLRDLLARGAPELTRYTLELLADRGLEWVEANRGLLESQADYISSL
jgi:hypothetical protein